MDFLTILIISFGVAMDAFAVSFSCGVTVKERRFFYALKMGLAFGFFQVLMPVLGWFIGTRLKFILENFDHWIAFVILATIGIKMIYESVTSRNDVCKIVNIDNLKILLLLSLATSIDALMVGVGFSVLNVNIIIPVLFMGLITFLMSMIGVLIGDKLGCSFGKRIEILGGIILIFIGTKILIEHLVGGN